MRIDLLNARVRELNYLHKLGERGIPSLNQDVNMIRHQHTRTNFNPIEPSVVL
jgi:hypothetical protein